MSFIKLFHPSHFVPFLPLHSSPAPLTFLTLFHTKNVKPASEPPNWAAIHLIISSLRAFSLFLSQTTSHILSIRSCFADHSQGDPPKNHRGGWIQSSALQTRFPGILIGEVTKQICKPVGVGGLRVILIQRQVWGGLPDYFHICFYVTLQTLLMLSSDRSLHCCEQTTTEK